MIRVYHTLAFAIAALLSTTSFAQPHKHISGLSLVVDGLEHPEQISDELAYRHFLMSVAQPSSPSSEEIARYNLQLAGIGFDDRDGIALLGLLSGLRDQLDQVRGSANSARAGSGDLLTAREAEERLLNAVADKARTALSSDGYFRLNKHIQEHVKRRIKTYDVFVH